VAVLFSDGFGSGTEPDATNWFESYGDWDLSSGQLINSSSANGQFNNLQTTTSAHAAVADCKVSFTRRVGTGFDAGPAARMSGSGNNGTTCYYASFVDGSTDVGVYRRNGATDTQIGSNITGVTHANGDVLSLEVEGTSSPVTLRIYVNGVLEGSVSDSSSPITSAGQCGIASWTNTGIFDDFQVEDLAAALSLEQEGYRWRADDGSESGATWEAAQDTTATFNTPKRLRVLINGVGDNGAETFQLEWKKSTDSTWRKVR
jgi:hypothetical protein